MAQQDFDKLKKLIAEVSKLNRQPLYDLSSPGYKNNHLKQTIWADISAAMDMNSKETQALWKRTKQKYKMALEKLNRPSGSSRQALKPVEDFLIKEMDFLRPHAEDDEPRTSSSNAEVQELFDELASDVGDSSDQTVSPTCKKRKTDNALICMLEKSFEKLDNIVKEKRTAQTEPTDYFYKFIEAERNKFPDDRQEQIQNQIIQLIFAKKLL